MQFVLQLPNRRYGRRVHYSVGELPRVGDRLTYSGRVYVVTGVEHRVSNKGSVTGTVVYVATM